VSIVKVFGILVFHILQEEYFTQLCMKVGTMERPYDAI